MRHATLKPLRWAVLPLAPALTAVLRAVLAGLLAGCAAPQPLRVQAGQTEAQMLAVMGPPTGRYALADGVQRIEFARGPYGVSTWMVDLDRAGSVLAIHQVLQAYYFDQVQDGMARDDLLRLLGRPASRQGEWQNRETWSWRYDNHDCLWIRVTLDARGKVWGGASTLPDPLCDPHV